MPGTSEFSSLIKDHLNQRIKLHNDSVLDKTTSEIGLSVIWLESTRIGHTTLVILDFKDCWSGATHRLQMNTILVRKVAFTEDHAKKWSVKVDADSNRWFFALHLYVCDFWKISLTQWPGRITEVLKNNIELRNRIMFEHFHIVRKRKWMAKNWASANSTSQGF